jgi:hypothetical protein
VAKIGSKLIEAQARGESQDFDNRGEPQADHGCAVCSGSLVGEDSDHFLRELVTERARQDE